MGRRDKISPFTLSRGTGLGGARALGQIFNIKQYRKLMAIMVIETNSSFTLVESNALRTLMAFSNGGAITISQRTLKRDIQSILYKGVFENLRLQLQEHIASGAKIKLTINA